MKLSVVDWNKKEVDQVEVPDELFGGPVRKDLLHQAVRWQLANRRQGTHKAKSRGEVRGGGAKPFRQKGTGHARQGTIRSPLMEGGAVIFGPTPRHYSFSMPKKVRRLALRNAVGYLLQEGRVTVVADMESSEGKTKEMATRLEKLGVSKACLVDGARNDMMERATRNLQKYNYGDVSGLNVYDLLKYDSAVMTVSAVKKMIERCRGEA